jgi:hypothetical protein
LDEEELTTGADPAEVPATGEADMSGDPAATVVAESAEEPGGEQLSLDEMVASLRDPEAGSDEPSGESPAGDAEDPTPAADPLDGAGEAEGPAEGETAGAAEPVAEIINEAAPEGFPRLARARLGARLPFWLYAVAWLVFAVGMAVALWPHATAPFTDRPLYAWFVLGGAALALLGPVTALVAWLALRAGSDPDERAGLGRALFLRASVATLTGSALWWAALIVLDLRRAGMLG